MQQNADVNGGGSKRLAEAEDVISRMKDDGDFDRLRLKIIRKLRENEELRSNIVSMVKQSASINHPGSESMKPRQLADRIHHEIGEKVMSQISDGLWKIIRSPEGMKTEISDTVRSVYDKLYWNGKNNDKSCLRGLHLIQSEVADVGVTTSCEMNGSLPVREPDEHPPGFVSTAQKQKTESKQNSQVDENGENFSFCPAPNVPCASTQMQSGHIKFEDPDVPPGFG